jgi:hypothetical protein
VDDVPPASLEAAASLPAEARESGHLYANIRGTGW